MDATCAIQASIHVFSLVRKYVSRILGTYQYGSPGFYILQNYFILLSEPVLPVLLPVLRSARGMVSRIHNPDQSHCRTLRKTDLHRALHRYRSAGSGGLSYLSRLPSSSADLHHSDPVLRTDRSR